jgi:ribosome biogenesis protein SSF1/2
MAGPLGVTHLLLFSKSKESGNTNLRLALTPRGPTLHFRVEKYSLCKDVTAGELDNNGFSVAVPAHIATDDAAGEYTTGYAVESGAED